MSWGRKKARFNISLARMPRLWRLQGKNELIFSSISQSHHMACFCGTSGLSSAIHCWQGVALLLLSSPSASHWYFGHTCVRYFGTAVVICCVQPLYRNNAPLFSCLFLQHRGQPVMLFGAHHCKTSCFWLLNAGFLCYVTIRGGKYFGYRACVYLRGVSVFLWK